MCIGRGRARAAFYLYDRRDAFFPSSAGGVALSSAAGEISFVSQDRSGHGAVVVETRHRPPWRRMRDLHGLKDGVAAGTDNRARLRSKKGLLQSRHRRFTPSSLCSQRLILLEFSTRRDRTIDVIKARPLLGAPSMAKTIGWRMTPREPAPSRGVGSRQARL